MCFGSEKTPVRALDVRDLSHYSPSYGCQPFGILIVRIAPSDSKIEASLTVFLQLLSECGKNFVYASTFSIHQQRKDPLTRSSFSFPDSNNVSLDAVDYSVQHLVAKSSVFLPRKGMKISAPLLDKLKTIRTHRDRMVRFAKWSELPHSVSCSVQEAPIYFGQQ